MVLKIIWKQMYTCRSWHSWSFLTLIFLFCWNTCHWILPFAVLVEELCQFPINTAVVAQASGGSFFLFLKLSWWKPWLSVVSVLSSVTARCVSTWSRVLMLQLFFFEGLRISWLAVCQSHVLPWYCTNLQDAERLFSPNHLSLLTLNVLVLVNNGVFLWCYQSKYTTSGAES